MQSVSGRLRFNQQVGTLRPSKSYLSRTCITRCDPARAHLDPLCAMAQKSGRSHRKILVRAGLAGNICRHVSRAVRRLPWDRRRNVSMATPIRNQLLFRAHLSVHAHGEREGVPSGASRLVAPANAPRSRTRRAVSVDTVVRTHQSVCKITIKRCAACRSSREHS